MNSTIILPGVRSHFTFDKRLYFVFLCLCNLFIVYLSNEFLLTDDVYYQTYGEQVAIERIESYLEFKRELWWLGYTFVPITLLIKIGLVTVCLNTGTLMVNIKTSFGQLFKIALVGEGVFVATNLIRIFWLAFVKDVQVLSDIQFFYPLSLINLFDPTTIESWYTYPLITSNVFEITYFLVLALGIHWKLNRPFGKSLRLVTASYGTGLFIWMIFIMFLTINLT